MRDRVRVDAGSANPPESDHVVHDLTTYPARHCWVAAPVDGVQPRPGLLLEWRRVDHLSVVT